MASYNVPDDMLQTLIDVYIRKICYLEAKPLVNAIEKIVDDANSREAALKIKTMQDQIKKDIEPKKK